MRVGCASFHGVPVHGRVQVTEVFQTSLKVLHPCEYYERKFMFLGSRVHMVTLLWSPACCGVCPWHIKSKAEKLHSAGGIYPFFRRFNLRLRGFREYYFFPRSALTEVWFIHHKDLVMSCTCLGILEILHRLLFWILKVVFGVSLKVCPSRGRHNVGKYQLGGTDRSRARLQLCYSYYYGEQLHHNSRLQ